MVTTTLYVMRADPRESFVPASAAEILTAAALELERWARARYGEEPNDDDGRALAGAERGLDGIRCVLAGTPAGRALELELDR